MNISQPVSSAINGLDFNFLPSEEIRKLSVKRITNPLAIDPILYGVVPGGLYDQALGAWADHRCTTCNLDRFSCPGHCGHIELPVHLYHPMLMDQCLRLLRSKCVYCHYLRMSATEVDRYCSKLRLLRHGLVNEANEVDKFGTTSSGGNKGGDSSDEEDSAENIIEKRSEFVRAAIRSAEKVEKGSTWSAQKTEAVAAARKRLIREFMAKIMAYRKCARCQGVSPAFRKDRFVKIFKKPLPQKHKDAMRAAALKAANPLLTYRDQQAKRAQEKNKKLQVDEAVADLELSEEEEGEDTMSNQDAENGDMLEDAAMDIPEEVVNGNDDTQEYLSSSEVHAALQLLFEREPDIMGLVYGPRTRAKSLKPLSADMFFIKTLLVSPNRFRPENIVNGNVTEHARNTHYSSILKICEEMNLSNQIIQNPEEDAARKQREIDNLTNNTIRLQDTVNVLLDSSKSPSAVIARTASDGIKQILEKKAGLFRMNMMGKRVNYAARSVISPDPNIETNEIGVPPVFAQKLTYPEPVTNHNFYELKQAVINGPFVWPGASAVESEDGVVISLLRKSADERLAIANQLLAPSNTKVNGARNKKVHRHLNNGDVVIMNRQPTLHKPSMMAHRARVLPGEKTIRMHYSNCNTYNADFDGDEMNMHFPQNEIARSEAIMVVDTDHQYLSGTAGNPLRGLIQDHISICVWLCNRDTFFNRHDYQELIYAALRPEDNHTTSGSIQTVEPAFLKPVKRWTGKQVISTILKNLKPESHLGLYLNSGSQTKASLWGSKDSEEGQVIIQDGDFLTGILDKKQIGPKHGGIVSAVHEAYGHTVAGKLLSSLGRLLTKMLHMNAFSCGVEDLVLTAEGEQDRRKELSAADKLGLSVAARYVSMENEQVKSDNPELRTRLERVLRNDDTLKGLDLATNSRTGELSSAVTGACLPDGLIKPFPKNFMQTMTGSGAKGSGVNANLISCNLGQQVLEGRRVPVMVSGKTLPCFKPLESHIRAGGYIVDRFLTGIRPQEYFFHAMAGREGLIDTAVKTSRSGYLQRCLVKNMEGLKVEYDTSVRDADGSMIQFLYGEDGLDITKQVYLRDFKFLASNFLSMYASLNIREDYARIQSDEASEASKQGWRKFQKTGDLGCRDPALADYNPARFCGSVSEEFYGARRKYMEENKDKLLKKKNKDSVGTVTKKNFEAALDVKYLRSIVEPGEAVGIVAGQSIGEPSTQMTLNTFHLAGHSAKNVTLGIPRLREIVMTASDKISTPDMTLFLQSGVTKEQAEKLAKNISRLPLTAIVENAHVTEKVGKGVGHAEARAYTIHLDFFPAAEYCKEYAITVFDVVHTVETLFVPQLHKRIRTEMKKKVKERQNKAKSDSRPEIGESAGTIEQERPAGRPGGRRDDDDDDDDDEEDEDDATAAKARANRDDEGDFDEPDEEDEAVVEQEDSESEPEDEAYGSAQGSASEESSSESDEESDEQGDSSDRRPKRFKGVDKDFEDRLKEANNDLISIKLTDISLTATFEYSSGAPKILMLHLLEAACNAATIRATSGITDCFYAEDKTEAYLTTQGENLVAMRAYTALLDPNRFYSNDIAAMQRLYGVEACRATIVKEIDAVFKGHGIDVDLRHLNLIADTMTRDGGFKAFNRLGLATNTSPLAKMSFETTVGFLKDALLEEESEELRGPSARIVVGRVGKVGTGGIDVLVPVAGMEMDADGEEMDVDDE